VLLWLLLPQALLHFTKQPPTILHTQGRAQLAHTLDVLHHLFLPPLLSLNDNCTLNSSFLDFILDQIGLFFRYIFNPRLDHLILIQYILSCLQLHRFWPVMTFWAKHVFFVGFLGELIVGQSGILEVGDGASPILESVLLLADVFRYVLNVSGIVFCV